MSYTQQSFTVNVNVRGFGVSGGGQGGTAGTDPATEENKLSAEEQTAAKAAKKRASNAKLAQHNMAQMAAGVARQLIFAGLNYTVSGIGMRTGDQFLQARANRIVSDAQTIVSTATGAASGFATGMAAGAMGGVLGMAVGGVVGAVLGAASPLISRGAEYMQGKREYQFEVWKQQSNINYNRTRAGIEDGRGRRNT